MHRLTMKKFFVRIMQGTNHHGEAKDQGTGIFDQFSPVRVILARVDL